MNNSKIEKVKTFIGRPCLYIEVPGDKMHLRTPESRMIIFSDYEVAIMSDGPDCPSDYGIEVDIKEIENNIVISMTDGMSEPYNHIYIFNK